MGHQYSSPLSCRSRTLLIPCGSCGAGHCCFWYVTQFCFKLKFIKVTNFYWWIWVLWVWYRVASAQRWSDQCNVVKTVWLSDLVEMLMSVLRWVVVALWLVWFCSLSCATVSQSCKVPEETWNPEASLWWTQQADRNSRRRLLKATTILNLLICEKSSSCWGELWKVHQSRSTVRPWRENWLRSVYCMYGNAAIVSGFISRISPSFPWHSSFTQGFLRHTQIYTKPPMSFHGYHSVLQQQDTQSPL